MNRYLLLQNGDRGETLMYWLDEEQLQRLLTHPDDWGITGFWDKEPDDEPAYWSDGLSLLLRVEILTPQQQVAWVLPQIPQESMRMIDKFLDDPEKLGSYRERPDPGPISVRTDRLRATWDAHKQPEQMWLTGHGIVTVEDAPDIATVSDSPLTHGD